jgi:hypothetical protein
MAPPRRPDPEPVQSDDVAIVTLGTGLWALALVATLLWRERLTADGRDSWVWVCAAGLFLGLVGVRHVRRRRAASRV